MKTIYPFMGLALCSVAAQAQEKPNFLIIQCDHLTQRVVGAYGQTQGCTLPMDEVASRGGIIPLHNAVPSANLHVQRYGVV